MDLALECFGVTGLEEVLYWFAIMLRPGVFSLVTRAATFFDFAVLLDIGTSGIPSVKLTPADCFTHLLALPFILEWSR